MGTFDGFKRRPVAPPVSPESLAVQRELAAMFADGNVPPTIVARLNASRSGKRPWIATLTPAELHIVRSHGIRPICAISAACWTYLARHIVVATTVDAKPGATLPAGVSMVVDMHADKTPLAHSRAHHQSYESNEREGAI